ncbi:unnamed protein product, partial [Cladocopium goreaui]
CPRRCLIQAPKGVSRQLDPFEYSEQLPDVEDLDSWEQLLPLHGLPPLPRRDPKFWQESFTGLTILVAMIVSLVSSVHLNIGSPQHWKFALWCSSADLVIQFLALLASSCIAIILFGRCGEVKRSKSTCYPIPAQVALRLLGTGACEAATHARNVQHPVGYAKLGSFCVRCLLWRDLEGHHCSICQRCVVHFDHHCGVLGRCIVRQTMKCLYLLLISALLGIFAVCLTNSWC